jgi:peptidyl-prolyl cis-trans isomerase A (cyclophilin A)
MVRNFSRIITGISLAALAIAAAAQGNPPAQKPAGAAKPAGATAGYDKALLSPSTLTAKAPETYDIKFVTTEGDFVVHVTRAWAPLGADRVFNLVKHHYFDGAAFFRVIPNFMAQFGLSAYPEINKAWMNANIHDDAVKHSNSRGTVTFAAQDSPNTRSTQLFINFANNAFLDQSRFAPFGEVTAGMDVVDKIYSGEREKPDQEKITLQGKAYLEKNFPKLTVIKSATVVTAPPPAGAAAKPSTKP